MKPDEREWHEDSFTDTAAAIWMHNPAARRDYATVSLLRTWMVEQTKHTNTECQGWGTLGFWISISNGWVKATVEGWFVLSLKAQEREP